MFRYLAFVWNDADTAARGSAESLALLLTERSASWRPVVERDGLRVYCSGERLGSSEAYVLHDGAGAVLGKLFRSGGRNAASVTAPLQIAEDETRRIVDSAGHRLIDSYWGRYVAFIHDEAAGVTRVLRDPSAGLPCFSVTYGGVHIYFSRMDDLPELPGRRFSVNWKYVAATLCQAQLHVHSTGVNEVEHTLGGECVEHRGGQTSRRFYWTLLEASHTNVIDDPVAAVDALRTVTRDCVHAWASSYRGIVHMLSGGLDSSIILACLKDAPGRPMTACLNYYSTGSNTDERAYAQLAARSAACELVEVERNSALSLEPLVHLRRAPVPSDYFFYLDQGRPEARVAAEKGARAMFTGYGGDQIFYRSRACHAAGDYLHARGLSPALFEVALDAARVDQISVWSVLGKAFRAQWLGKRWHVWDEQTGRRRKLIRQDVADDIKRDVSLMHPTLQSIGNEPDGKRYHAYQLLFPAEFYNPLGSDDDPEFVSPLFSQPLLELVMRLPTWLHSRGGWDRALARRAFQHEVPRQIVTRRTKGGQEEHAKAILLRNFGFVRNLLVDGYLVREGLLDRAQVAEVLSPGPARLNSGNAELFGCLSAEAWVRQWTTA